MIKVLAVVLILLALDNTNWTAVEIDEKVTIELPDNFIKIDTLGLLIYMGGTESSIVSLSVGSKNSLYAYANNQELIRNCDNLIDGFLSSFKDVKVLSKTEYQLNEVNSRKLEFRYNDNETMYHCISVFFILDETPYTLVARSEKMLECSKDFKLMASSIRCKK